MDDRSKQFKVGVVVVATVLITMLLVIFTSDFSWMPFRNQYQLQVLVSQAPGVAPKTPVRRRGILIGRVSTVEDTDEGALITIDIDEGKHIKSNEIARIQTSLIGDAVVEFMPASPSQGAQIVQPGGAPLRGMYNPSPLDLIANLQGDLKQTIQSLGRAGDEVSLMAERLNDVLGGQDIERIDRLVNSTELAMNNFSGVMTNLNDVLGDDQFKAQLKKGLGQLPAVITDAEQILIVLRKAIGSADVNLKNLQGLTGPLGDRGPEIVDAMETSVSNLSDLLGEVALLGKNINNSEGTIGKLINDDDLYRQLAALLSQATNTIGQATGTINQATGAIADVRNLINDRHLRVRIRQILDNINSFAQKLAQDPARVVRGIVPRNRELPIR